MGRQEVGFSIKDFEEVHELFMDKEEKSEEVLQILKKENEILKRRFISKLFSEYIQEALTKIHSNKRSNGVDSHLLNKKNQNKIESSSNEKIEETPIMCEKDMIGVFVLQ